MSVNTCCTAALPALVIDRQPCRLVLGGLVGLDIVTVDVNTVSPPHDVQNLTAFLAAQIIYEGLVLLCRWPH
jgi:hypothetical protein